MWLVRGIGVIAGAVLAVVVPAPAAGQDWDVPRGVAEGYFIGSDLELDAQGGAVVAWAEVSASPATYEVRAMRIAPDGRSAPPQVVHAGAYDQRHSYRTRLDVDVAADGHALVAWMTSAGAFAASARPGDAFGAARLLRAWPEGNQVLGVSAAIGTVRGVIAFSGFDAGVPRCFVASWPAGAQQPSSVEDVAPDPGPAECGEVDVDDHGTAWLQITTGEQGTSVGTLGSDGTASFHLLFGGGWAGGPLRVSGGGRVVTTMGTYDVARLFDGLPGEPVVERHAAVPMWGDLDLDPDGRAATAGVRVGSNHQVVDVHTEGPRGLLGDPVHPPAAPFVHDADVVFAGRDEVLVVTAGSDAAGNWSIVVASTDPELRSWQRQHVIDGADVQAVDASPSGQAMVLWRAGLQDGATRLMVSRRGPRPVPEVAVPGAARPGPGPGSTGPALRQGPASVARLRAALPAQRLSTVWRRGRLRVICAGASGARCDVRATVTRQVARQLGLRRRTLGTARRRLGQSGREVVAVRLSRSIRRAISRADVVPVHVRAKVTGADGRALVDTAARRLRG